MDHVCVLVVLAIHACWFVTSLRPCDSFGTFGTESGIFVLVNLNATLVCRKPETKRPLPGTHTSPQQRHTGWPFREIRISATEIAFRFWEELQLGQKVFCFGRLSISDGVGRSREFPASVDVKADLANSPGSPILVAEEHPPAEFQVTALIVAVINVEYLCPNNVFKRCPTIVYRITPGGVSMWFWKDRWKTKLAFGALVGMQGRAPGAGRRSWPRGTVTERCRAAVYAHERYSKAVGWLRVKQDCRLRRIAVF